MSLMNEWPLLLLLMNLGLVGCLFLLYPLRRYRSLCIFLLPVVLLLLVGSYAYWGGFASWHRWHYQEEARQTVQAVLETIKKPEDLIDKLKAKLNDNPRSAKGWYLLGRLYSSQNDKPNANKAYAKAYHSNPEQEEFAAAFAYSSWQMNHRRFTVQTRSILNHLLDKNPNQADALSMLAYDSFLHHDYDSAILRWQSLLKQVPEHSKEEAYLRRAIAKAYHFK